jgi:lipopolysaccharide transport system permease protein
MYMSIAASSVFPSSARVARQVQIVRMSAARQLKVRYRGTLVGVLWSFGNPVLMTGLYTALFGTAFASYYQGSTTRYIISVFIGVVVVTFFSQSTAEALVSVVANGPLMNKVPVDPEIFPAASVLANTLQQAMTTFPVLILLTAFITRDPLRVLLTIVLVGSLVALVTGFSLMLSALYVYARDLQNLWNVVGFIIWMTAAVFYPVALAPGGVRAYFDVNPIGLTIASLRDVMLTRGDYDLLEPGKCIIISIVFLFVGHAIFRSLRRGFMDLV